VPAKWAAIAVNAAKGAPCPVYASKETLDLLRGFPIQDRREMPIKKSVMIDGVKFKAYPVQHSVRAPAVGYRVSANGVSFFYVPDVAGLPDAPNALRGGQRLHRRRSDYDTLNGAQEERRVDRPRSHYGATQLVQNGGYSPRYFHPCGSPIVRGNARVLDAAIKQLGREQGIDASLACDGNRFSLSGAPSSSAGLRCRPLA